MAYDVTSFESFEGAKSWVRELKLYGQPNVVIALAANKCDLDQYRLVSQQEGQTYARENDMPYFETSAKTAHNVRRMFVDLGEPSRPAPPAPRTPRRRTPLTSCVPRHPSQRSVCHARTGVRSTRPRSSINLATPTNRAAANDEAS